MGEQKGNFNIWGGDVVLGALNADDEGLGAILGNQEVNVGTARQLTYLSGKPKDLERSHRRAIGITEELEEIAAVELLMGVIGIWKALHSESIWRVEFGATLNQWEIRRKGKWYRRKVK